MASGLMAHALVQLISKNTYAIRNPDTNMCASDSNLTQAQTYLFLILLTHISLM